MLGLHEAIIPSDSLKTRYRRKQLVFLHIHFQLNKRNLPKAEMERSGISVLEASHTPASDESSLMKLPEGESPPKYSTKGLVATNSCVATSSSASYMISLSEPALETCPFHQIHVKFEGLVMTFHQFL